MIILKILLWIFFIAFFGAAFYGLIGMSILVGRANSGKKHEDDDD